METEDPRVALQDKSVAVRAAAARDLSKVGTPDDLAALVAIAIDEKSSALRLYAAAAAADILHRHRAATGKAKLTKAQIAQVHQWVKGYDPGKNPGLLMMLSAIPDEESRTRLVRMLKDPRNGVRGGALVAIRRMAVVASAQTDEDLPKALGPVLADPRTPPDVAVDLVRLVGEVGWSSLRDAVKLAAGRDRLMGEVGTEALRRLDSRLDPAGWDGVWIGDGLDVYEVGDRNEEGPWRLLSGGTICEGGAPVPFAIDARGRATLPGDPAPARLLWIQRPGFPEEIRRGIQHGPRTYWRQDSKDLLEVVERVIDGSTEVAAPAMRALATWLGAIEGVVAPRRKAIALWRAGDRDEALAILDEQVAKKAPPELLWWHARVQADLGKNAEAKESLDAFLDKVGKKAKYRAEAEALRKSLR